jgi:hypothetical protein
VSIQQEKQQKQQTEMMMEQQAMAQQQMGGGVPGEVPQGEEQLEEQMAMDVSPENVEESDGPAIPVNGEIDVQKDAMNEPNVGNGSNLEQILRAVFNALGINKSDAPEPDIELQTQETVQEEPNDLTERFTELFDDYTDCGIAAEEFKQDLRNALETQQMTDVFEQEFNAHTLAHQLGEMMDVQALSNRMSELLWERVRKQSNHKNTMLQSLLEQFGHESEKYAFDDPKTYWHGTSTAVVPDTEFKLRPPSETTKIQEAGTKKNLDKVFMTSDPNSAKIYAGRAVRQFGGEPVVRRAIPAGDVEQIQDKSGTSVFATPHAFLDQRDDKYTQQGTPERYAKGWTPYHGPREGKGWKNLMTGEIRYQESMPTDSGVQKKNGFHKSGKTQMSPKSSRIHAPEPGGTWIGFMLDGGLAYPIESDDPREIGEPIPKAIKLVKKLLHHGVDVRIFTPRVADHENERPIRRAIKTWSKQYIGDVLPITYRHDEKMAKLIDDMVGEKKDESTQPSDEISKPKAEEMLENPPHDQPLTEPQEKMLQAAAHKYTAEHDIEQVSEWHGLTDDEQSQLRELFYSDETLEPAQ